VKQLIHISSCVSYGLDFQDFPVTETHPLTSDYTNEYSQGKTEGEIAIRSAIDNGFPATVLKFASTIGGYTGPKRLLTGQLAWIDRIKKGKPLLIASEDPLMQFLASEDAVAGVMEVINSEKAIGEVYNLTNPEAITWSEHDKAVMRALGNDVELIPVPTDVLMSADIPAGDCFHEFSVPTHFSMDKFCCDFPNWKARVSYETMFGNAIKVLEDQGVIPNCEDDEFAWEDQLIEKFL
ncbi:MAG: NAD-dependent epimerase/dehydratase family protein, partial [Lentisphaeria bacterium]|nr:NAD-dependent epimerase/dehydratase family protein [Lentisphaeria bacterium]